MNFQALIEELHKCVAADLDLTALEIEYNEIVDLGLYEKLAKLSMIERVENLIKLETYPNVLTIYSRITAAKPHSADVERFISCANIIKSAHRSSITVETENLFLYIYFNMPPLASWDPRPAICKWLDKKDRRGRDCPKDTDQEWFNGIFDRPIILSEKKKRKNLHNRQLGNRAVSKFS